MSEFVPLMERPSVQRRLGLRAVPRSALSTRGSRPEPMPQRDRGKHLLADQSRFSLQPLWVSVMLVGLSAINAASLYSQGPWWNRALVGVWLAGLVAVFVSMTRDYRKIRAHFAAVPADAIYGGLAGWQRSPGKRRPTASGIMTIDRRAVSWEPSIRPKQQRQAQPLTVPVDRIASTAFGSLAHAQTTFTVIDADGTHYHFLTRDAEEIEYALRAAGVYR